MIEDKLLILRAKRRSVRAFNRIYLKYKNYLLTVATALLSDISLSEDCVHDVFVAFARSITQFELTGSLKTYLAICVTNRARNMNKLAKPISLSEQQENMCTSGSPRPDQSAILSESSTRVNRALAQLNYEQREVVTLHLISGMTFRHIAELKNKSINTIQSRYRYGMENLQSLLSEEAAQ
jgi:RNA polymerase sigma factor (sigma-70 family)